MNLSIATIGNPNSGKTTLFNMLTGANQNVGNWSGVTVEKKTGYFSLSDKTDVRIIDLPGIYSLDYDSEGSSLDERVAFDYIMQNSPDVIINVIDASCLERSLYLTVQLKELGLPVVAVINKMDVALKKKLLINEKSLAKKLGCPVVTISAHDKKSVAKLSQQLQTLSEKNLTTPIELDYGSTLTPIIETSTQLLEKVTHHLQNRALAIKLLEGDETVLSLLPKVEQAIFIEQKSLLSAQQNEEIDLQIADTRYSFIYQVTQDSVRTQGKLGRSITEKIDALVMNRYAGVPFFLLVMYLMFMFSINIGSAFIDFFDISAGAIFVDGSAQLLSAISAPDWLINVLAYGVGNGIQTVMTFIPVIACLYLFLAVLEASGYLARAAFVIDKAMQFIGLPGKSFVPMIVGFGCTVPAVMAARTLEKERERLLTVVMSPFMSCGARLPVYALFASAFFPDRGQNIVFILYLIGIAVAVLTGYILSRTLLPGKSENMFLEIPDYELPTLRNTLTKTWQKLKGFLFGAGQTIVIVVTLLNVINSIGLDGSFGHQDSADSLLSKSAQIITPVLSPLGVTQDNWPATVGIVTGLFAKEAVVGTLNNLYSTQQSDDEAELTLLEKLNEAVATIPENLMGISVSDPLGIDVGDLGDLQAAAEDQGVDLTIFKNIQDAFVTPEAAFAYLLFILLYAPCAAAMGAIVREVGGQWAKFIAIWTSAVAYIVSVSYYQIATFSMQPNSHVLYIIVSIVIMGGVVFMLKRRGNVLAVSLVS
ncbi:Fe(2+) transporter permease subunit FeoB [Psychromonas sp. Urea-02u-13]|uniref:Fe(2+) transporter permease subunit FeoB n=1 Tax=Psychromonas sp. Urea-02u-13 TaxID=2058326 RepID=UPI000C332CED|nr:Fe(2+) transporter permease subunit FeoB [Psychromonas sp. Urea-02u-13]PKG40406.1 ferrous iron transporter B [Psychromonas sp. Urea-02u-13]